MPAHNPPIWPQRWLMTDARLGDRVEAAARRLPEGAGIVLRHDHWPAPQRQALGERLAVIARDQGLTLAVAGDVALAQRLGAALVHRPLGDPGDLPFSEPVHDQRQAEAARQSGAALVFISPIFPTRSHPGQPSLGVAQAVRLAGRAGCPAIALGGMDEARWQRLPPGIFHGWAAISAWQVAG